ncbi:MAG: hypothetical protein IJ590_03925 [Rickettsiales bacterium]|nr:hypothetical protein [Rickettsiales bacterium]
MCIGTIIKAVPKIVKILIIVAMFVGLWFILTLLNNKFHIFSVFGNIMQYVVDGVGKGLKALGMKT